MLKGSLSIIIKKKTPKGLFFNNLIAAKTPGIEEEQYHSPVDKQLPVPGDE